MKMTNALAQAIITECMASMEEGLVADALVMLHNGEMRVKDAQIAAECLQRVVPSITPGEYKKAASDVLSYYVEGDCLDCISHSKGFGICEH